MRTALMQVITGRDVAANLDIVRDRTARAADAGAELVIFPEATMRAFGHSLKGVAEPLDGPFASAVQEIAARHGATIALGIFTPGDGGRVRNTLLVAGPDGILAAYDKIHLFDAFGFAESDTVTPGSEPTVCRIGGVPVGLAVCYDVRFPNLFVRLADAGAKVIILPASWGAGTTDEQRADKLDQWRLLTRARALDSTCFIVAVGQGDPATIGQEPSGAPTGIGHSMAVAPDGWVLCELGDGVEFRVIDINPDGVVPIRAAIPVLENRRI
ncbi:carbon-nitrogen hydrolase family protein [Acidipropionibacterium virtanenii]|uniref:Hydrolase n=1 Tax=Acidipropionibacterium virtanenii TaxID=2057246 RepID=A0A344UXU4_9ACTN|nr:carbon-nitrogen hydrolase family protein [Acidipropionibacterium virtanenii]AXE40092.1 Hydrolase [Acidipropionibacterium virtanenii]